MSAPTESAPRGALASAAPWTVKSHLPGRLRAHHPTLRRSAVGSDLLRLRILAIPGVESVHFNPVTARVLVRYEEAEVSAAGILDRITVLLDEPPPSGLEAQGGVTGADFRSERRLSIATVNLGLAAAASRLPVLRLPALLGTAFAASPIFGSALRALLVRRKLKVDVLDSIVIGILMATNSFFAAAIMSWLLYLADTILESTSRSSRELIGELFGEPSRTCWQMLPDGREVQRPVHELAIGDWVVVREGERIPVDGVVLAGQASVDQHMLNGEHAPVDRGTGETVFGMTTVLAGRLTIEVRETAETSNAARIQQIVARGLEHRVQLQSVSERFADDMVVPTFALGGVGYLLTGPQAMVAILNADYGTGIRVACPLALVTSLSVAARHGIVIKRGKVLETIRDVDVVVFDKTGTLTREIPEVGEIYAYDEEMSPGRILAYAACAEKRFTHPIARAILSRAEELGLELPPLVESTHHVGFGISATVDGQLLQVGSRRFLDQEGVATDGPAEADLAAVAETGASVVLVALDGRLVGIIEIRSTAREEAQRVVDGLKNRPGIRDVVLLSGDHETATAALARRLGIDTHHAEMLPDEKARYIQDLQARGLRVAMIGDGINDTPALTAADCSISISGASDIALDVADVVFVSGGLDRFDHLIELSEQLNTNVHRSFALVIVPNTLLILGALGGWFGLGSSIVLNNFFNLLAALNGLLPFRSARRALRRDTAATGRRPGDPGEAAP